MKRIDERDIIFSRMAYESGSEEYKDYYKKNIGKEEVDIELRRKWTEENEKTAYFDSILSPIIDGNFNFLADMKKYVEGPINPKKVDVEKDRITSILKGLAKQFGAVLCGTLKMKDYHFYSNRGRNNSYGEKVDVDKHPYGIVFAVEMEKDMINRAPKIAESIEVTKGYINAGVIGMVLSYYLRELGYKARNHMDGNYLSVLPLVAQDAGLGEIGRNGILITKKYGQRVRLGLVTTEIPLEEDSYKDMGLNKFCEICNRCAKVCPGKAINKDEKQTIDGQLRWKIDQEKCFNIWTHLGTDCGVCMTACPFSQGIEEDDFVKLLKSKEEREKILEKYNQKLGMRTFIKENPSWL